MYLKNLEMVGFKSFADKTSVDFLRGVVAIVGPNGCGKSNVSDAIRWVLGEQSAKALRGGEMADVIFSGTDTRKAISMAEVSMTFADCKDVLKTGQLAGVDANFDEVTITRRVFRDGNSDYLINKTPCRLKDVQSLFMDTGIGRSSYSIMEQGKIDKILSSHPEDRRAIFEEAAGITKFKTQKKEALRKLEYTEANLVRVEDIIREVKRQIGSLQRQVGKARRYKALTEEVRLLDTQLARHDYEGVLSTTQWLEQEAVELKTKIDDVRLEIESAEGNITHLREQFSATELRRQEVLQRQRDLQSEIERQETRIRTHQDRIAETNTAIQNAEREASESRTRQIELQNKLQTTQESLAAARERLSRQTTELEQARAAFSQVDQARKEHNTVIQGLQSTLLGLEGTLANLRNQSATLDKQRHEFSVRLQKLSNERTLACEERHKLAQRQESLTIEIQSFKHTFEASRHAVLGGEDALREAEHQCQALVTKISEEQRVLSEKTSRRDVLRQLQSSYEGYSEGAQALLRQVTDPSQEGAAQVQSAIRGTLANLIEVEPKYATAVEAALGQALQSIVVADVPTAMHLVDQLRVREWGRAFFAIQAEASPESPSMHFKREPLLGALCWANDIVRPSDVVTNFVRKLLADMVIVEDLTKAVDLRQYHPGLTFITVDGDVLDYQGILSAGSKRSSPLQLIGRRNEIAALDAEVAQVEAHLNEMSASKGEWEGRRAFARQSLGDRQSELRLQENDMTKKEAFSSAMQSEERDLESRVHTIDLEIQEIERQRKQNDEDHARVHGELGGAESRQVAVQGELSAATQRAEELAAEHHQRSVTANDLRVAHATTEQEIRGSESQIQPIESQLADARQFIASRETEVRASRQRIVQWQGESAEATQQIEAMKVSAQSIAGQLGELEKEKERFETEIHVAVELLRDQRQQMEALQKSITDHEIKLTEKRGELQHLADRMQREYQVDLATLELLPLQPGEDTPTRRKKVEVQTEEGEDESAAAPVETPVPTRLNFETWEQVSARVEELRAKIASMGPVNLEAVKEYDELEQRFTFLTREHQDLVTSKEQLHSILQKINGTTRKMFFETFEKIRENFQGVFKELFGGGKADLVLLDETDPLECGIDIVAKPPGKQLQSIMLLSGGERTMTAVSLLFAIYMVKPSPFCVLDEMDAPLDESNINRFIKMLERFLVHSQFVIITHNKRTIGMADALYGVTMEERGVSKLVSVKFHKKANASAPLSSQPEASEAEESSKSRLLVDVPPLDASSENVGKVEDVASE